MGIHEGLPVSRVLFEPPLMPIRRYPGGFGRCGDARRLPEGSQESGLLGDAATLRQRGPGDCPQLALLMPKAWYCSPTVRTERSALVKTRVIGNL
jgi:hypothetical protein